MFSYFGVYFDFVAMQVSRLFPVVEREALFGKSKRATRSLSQAHPYLPFPRCIYCLWEGSIWVRVRVMDLVKERLGGGTVERLRRIIPLSSCHRLMANQWSIHAVKLT